jgi:DNA-binding MarR family transcriptional regulator
VEHQGGNDPAEGPWLSDDEQLAWRGFLRMHTLVQGRLRRHLQQDTDLSLADYEVLVNLSEAPEGALRSYQLAEEMQWEASRLSHHLRRMEQRGLVRRESCGNDGRGIVVVLSEDGRAAIEQAAPKHVAEVRKVFIDAFDERQLAALIELATALDARHLDLPDAVDLATRSGAA